MSKVNDYDKYAALRQKALVSGEKLPHKYVEKPMMKKMLPDLTGKTVLLLGCGSGEESAIIKEAGAKKIVGIDNSAESINLAKQTYPEHDFTVGDMHKINYPDNSFDFVYSSLAVHYSDRPKKVYEEVLRVLNQGGKFLFSVAHPVRWASQKVDIDGVTVHLTGFSIHGATHKKYGKYLTFAEHAHHFPTGEVLKIWVGCPSFHFKQLKDSGFIIEDFVESKVIDECKEVDPWYFERYSEVPQFMAFLARKPE